MQTKLLLAGQTYQENESVGDVDTADLNVNPLLFRTLIPVQTTARKNSLRNCALNAYQVLNQFLMVKK